MIEVYTLYWVARDGSAQIELGQYDSRGEANEAIPDAWETLQSPGYSYSDPALWRQRGTMEVVKENLHEEGGE